MRVSFNGGAAVVTGIGAFEPRHIFDNGQAFRFAEQPDGSYSGVAHARHINVSKHAGGARLFPCAPEDFANIWHNYFDFGRSYPALFAGTTDTALLAGMDFAPGLRVLNQEPFETLISFIVSANNNIPRIRGIISRLCERWGAPVAAPPGTAAFSFPDAHALANANEKDLKAIGLGYRAPYVLRTAIEVSRGFPLASAADLPYQDAKNLLQKLPGVGPKVADCVLLFALGHADAFPADVWIKRFLAERYGFTGTDRQIYAFAKSRFGPAAGIAQQYLFYYARMFKNT